MDEVILQSLLCTLIFIISMLVASVILVIVSIWINKWECNMLYEEAMKKRQRKESEGEGEQDGR